VSAELEFQAGAKAAALDRARDKPLNLGPAPYRRVSNPPEAERRPPVNTGISERVLLWIGDHPGATVSECAEALGERRDAVQGAFSHLRNRGEIEYAEPPAGATAPRKYRVASRPLSSEQAQAVEALLASESPAPDLVASEAALARKIEQAKASPMLDEAQEQAAAELLAMESGQLELDPVAVLLWRAVMASENAIAAYLRQRPDPVLDALSDQAARARETLELWRRQRKAQIAP
jgi:hypothetical protein